VVKYRKTRSRSKCHF